jgi:hypothetical protein
MLLEAMKSFVLTSNIFRLRGIWSSRHGDYEDNFLLSLCLGGTRCLHDRRSNSSVEKWHWYRRRKYQDQAYKETDKSRRNKKCGKRTKRNVAVAFSRSFYGGTVVKRMAGRNNWGGRGGEGQEKQTRLLQWAWGDNREKIRRRTRDTCTLRNCVTGRVKKREDLLHGATPQRKKEFIFLLYKFEDRSSSPVTEKSDCWRRWRSFKS